MKSEEKIVEMTAQELLDELKKEQKADEERAKWAEEQHYNKIHPIYSYSKQKKTRQKPQKHTETHIKRKT